MEILFFLVAIIGILYSSIYIVNNTKRKHTCKNKDNKDIFQEEDVSQDKESVNPQQSLSKSTKDVTYPMEHSKRKSASIKTNESPKVVQTSSVMEKMGFKCKSQPKTSTSYASLLEQPEWKEKRLHIIRRDGHRCQYCGATDNLRVHHKYYLQYPNHTKLKPWEYPDTALITLCDTCHKKVHDTKKIKVYYRKYNG